MTRREYLSKFKNVFTYSAGAEVWFKKIMATLGYECISTFYYDLSIAEYVSGEKGVKDTIRNVKKSWISDHKMFTEFALALAYKAIQWENVDVELSQFYGDAYYEVRDYYYDHYKNNEDAKTYFFNVTD